MNLSDALLDLIISIIVMLVAVVSVWKDVYNKNSPKKGLRKFTLIGIILIGASFVFITMNFIKDNKTELKLEDAQKAKEKADSIATAAQTRLQHSQDELLKSQGELARLEISMKDAIIKKVDSSYTKSLKSSNEALAKYHVKIIDSLHTVVGTLKLNAVNPQLALAPARPRAPVFLDKVGNDTLMKIQFMSSNSTSYHIQMCAYFFIPGNDGDLLIQKDTVFNGGLFINEGITSTRIETLNKILLNNPVVKVVLTGSFSKDPYGKEIIPYTESFIFNCVENKYLGKFEVNQENLQAIIKLPLNGQ